MGNQAKSFKSSYKSIQPALPISSNKGSATQKGMFTTELSLNTVIIKLQNRRNPGIFQGTSIDQEHCTYRWVSEASFLSVYIDSHMNASWCDINVCSLVSHGSAWAMGVSVCRGRLSPGMCVGLWVLHVLLYWWLYLSYWGYVYMCRSRSESAGD